MPARNFASAAVKAAAIGLAGLIATGTGLALASNADPAVDPKVRSSHDVPAQEVDDSEPAAAPPADDVGDEEPFLGDPEFDPETEDGDDVEPSDDVGDEEPFLGDPEFDPEPESDEDASPDEEQETEEPFLGDPEFSGEEN